jgi:hypothetical protein
VTAYPMTAYPMTATPGAAVAGPAVGGRQPAVDEAMRQQAAAVLQHTYRWFETAIPAAPQLSGLISPMVTAVQLYQAQQYAACLDRAGAVIGSLQQARWAFPTLPPL